MTKADLAALVSDAVAESRILDYKSELPGSTDEGKRNFLKSVNALANTEGGVIAYGVWARDATGAETGIAQEIRGLPPFDYDKVKLALLQSVQSNLEPTIGSALEFQQVIGAGSLGDVLLLGIPRSFTGPHRVTFKGMNKFFIRTAGGVAEPDVNELRRMFNEQQDWMNQLESFRDTRLATLASGPVARSIEPRAPMIIHVLPLGRLGQWIDIRDRHSELVSALYPPGENGANGRYNADGFIAYHQADKVMKSYTQWFRFGGVEGYDSGNVLLPDESRIYPEFQAEYVQKTLRNWVPRAIRALEKQLQIEPPFAIGLTLRSLLDSVAPDRTRRHFSLKIDVDELRSPFIVVNDTAASVVDDALWSILDPMWQAAGYSSAPRT